MIVPSESVRKKIQVISRIYDVVELISDAEHRHVYKAISKSTGDVVSIKMCFCNSLKDMEIIEGEINILNKLRLNPHKNLIKLLDVLFWKNTYFIITEFYEGGDLLNLFSQNEFVDSPEKIRFIAYSIASAIQHLNRMGIVHRDIKLENIVISGKGVPILIDMGIAAERTVGTTMRMRDNCGSIVYIAPEICECANGQRKYYGEGVDVWSLGVCLYILANGETLPSLNGKVTIPKGDKIQLPMYLEELVCKMLERNPAYRISIDDVLQLLSHFNRYSNESVEEPMVEVRLKKLLSVSKTNNTPETDYTDLKSKSRDDKSRRSRGSKSTSATLEKVTTYVSLLKKHVTTLIRRGESSQSPSIL